MPTKDGKNHIVNATLDGMCSDGFATVPEAAEFLRVSRASLYVLMETGELAYAKFGKCRRIPRRALSAYAERHIVQR
jgi:excisionase family DNA binding protein